MKLARARRKWRSQVVSALIHNYDIQNVKDALTGTAVDFSIARLSLPCLFQDGLQDSRNPEEWKLETFLKAFKAYERGLASRMNTGSVHGDWIAMQKMIPRLFYPQFSFPGFW